MYTGCYTPRPSRKKARFMVLLLTGAALVLILAVILAGLLISHDIGFVQNKTDGAVYFGDAAVLAEIPGIRTTDLPLYTIVSVISSGTDTEPQEDGRAVLSPSQIYEKYADCVVGIEAVLGQSSGWGTGFLVSRDGYIVTNQHVVEGAGMLTVTMTDNKEYTAEVVGSDRVSDIAVLKIKAENCPVVEFGDSVVLQHGEAVCAIGNPAGLQNTITAGIISGINRDITLSDAAGDVTMTVLQTDCAVNPGNSGGPLFNEYGQVVGIISSKLISGNSGAYEGLGFAIPSGTAVPLIAELTEYGHISGRPALGISIDTGFEIDAETAAVYGIPAGLLVAKVDPKSDAYAKGMRERDILTHVNSIPILTMEELSALKNEYTVGDTLTMTVYRKGESIDMDVRLMDESELK